MEDYGQGRRFFIVEEEGLRQMIAALSPDIRRDTERMADLIREMVSIERQKAGLDKPHGSLELFPNKEKKLASDPDLTGAGRIAGRFYRAAGWVSKTDTLRISLLPRKPR
jgi:hypothetical protein